MIPITQPDIEARLLRTLTPSEVQWLPGVEEEASAVIEAYLGVTYAPGDDIPAPVFITTARVAGRMLTSSVGGSVGGGAGAIPVGLDQRSVGMGPFNASLHYVADATAGGPWLSAFDKNIMLNPYRVAAVNCVPLYRELGD